MAGRAHMPQLHFSIAMITATSARLQLLTSSRCTQHPGNSMAVLHRQGTHRADPQGCGEANHAGAQHADLLGWC